MQQCIFKVEYAEISSSIHFNQFVNNLAIYYS